MKKITVALAAMLIISLICIGCSQGSVNEASSKEDSSVFSEPVSRTSSVTTEESEEVSSDTVTSIEEESSEQSEPASSLPHVSSEAPLSSEEPTSSSPPAPSEPPVSSEYDFSNVTYESYNKMSSDEQYAFIQTFESPADFALWYHEEKAKYEAEHPPIEIGPGGNIDLSSIGGSR